MENKTKKNIGVSLAALTAVSALAIGAYAYGPAQYLYESNDAIRDAIITNDYDAFVEAVAQIDVEAASRISQDKFDNLVDRFDTKELVDEAIENRDYDAWVAAVQAMPHGADIADVVSEEEFDLLIELHENRERNKEIAEEIGLKEMKQERVQERMDNRLENRANGEHRDRGGFKERSFNGGSVE